MRKSKVTGTARVLALPILAAVMLASVAVVAAAEAPTRDEYVDQLERICKPDAEATQRAMNGARGDMAAERLATAAAKVAKASSIFSSTVQQIAAVPRPPADAPKLAKWFGYLRAQASYLKRITTQLRARRGVAAQRLTARLIHNGNLANNVVLAFGFDYCSFKFSRYG